MSEPRKSVFLPIGTEQEVHVSAEEKKKKVRVEKKRYVARVRLCLKMSCWVSPRLQVNQSMSAQLHFVKTTV